MRLLVLLKLALRELKRDFRKLFILFFCLFWGVMALTFVLTFENQIRSYIDDKSRYLITGDLRIVTRFKPGETFYELLEALERTGNKISLTEETNSVIRNLEEKTKATLVNLKIVSQNYPLYGEVLLDNNGIYKYPAEDEIYMSPATFSKLNIAVGDSIRIGESNFLVKNAYLELPDRNLSFFSLGDDLLISKAGFERTKLVKAGSRISYKASIKLAKIEDLEMIKNLVRNEFSDRRYDLETFEEGPDNVDDALRNFRKFFIAISLVTLLLGGFGLVLFMSSYLNNKKNQIAIFKILGLKSFEIEIYFIFIALIIGIFSGLIGALSGLILNYFSIGFIQDIIGVKIDFYIPYFILARAVGVSILMIFLSTIFPILNTSYFYPLAIIRKDNSSSKKEIQRKDLLIISFLLISVYLLFSVIIRSYEVSLYTLLGVIALSFLLYGFNFLIFKLIYFLKDIFKDSTIKWGITLFFAEKKLKLIILTFFTISLIALFFIIFLAGNLNKVLFIDNENSFPKAVLIDVQKNQIESLNDSIQAEKIEAYPVVRGRVSFLDGIKVDRRERDLPDGLGREFNLTYRDYLVPNETISRGEFWDAGTDLKFVSVDSERAEVYGIRLGSKIVFDIQGIPIEVTVSNLRQVEKRANQPFFYFLFPEKLLKDAPHNYFVLIYDQDIDAISLQNDLAVKFPNISLLDVKEIQKVVLKFLSDISKTVLFLSSFILIMSLFIFLGMIQATSNLRERDVLLMKILGASKRFLWKVYLIEFFLYGLISAFLSIFLSIVVSLIIFKVYFDIYSFYFDFDVLIVLSCLFIAIFLIGFFSMQKIFKKRPMELLRTR